MISKQIDVLCAGELIADIIAVQEGKLKDAEDLKIQLGGSPTNLASHLKRLGHNINLVATLGNDGIGDHLKKHLEELNIDLKHVKTHNELSTSIIIINRNQATPEFIPYRQADSNITTDQLPVSLISNVKIFHTTCFALSKEPAQHTILAKAKEAYQADCQLSIDLNYSNKIWHSQKQPLQVIEEFCQYNPLLKISEDDKQRFLGDVTHDEMFTYFHQLGVDRICFTQGKKGIMYSQKGQEFIKLSSPKLDHIEDTTGAGDAFWSGFLSSYIKQYNTKECLKNGLKYAAFKLLNGHKIPNKISLENL